MFINIVVNFILFIEYMKYIKSKCKKNVIFKKDFGYHLTLVFKLFLKSVHLVF